MPVISIDVRENSCICKVNLLIYVPFGGILIHVELYFPLSYLEVTFVDISYKKLWKLLIDKDMKKKDLCEKAGISPASVTKLGKNGHVTTEILLKICTALDCGIEDIMEIVADE